MNGSRQFTLTLLALLFTGCQTAPHRSAHPPVKLGVEVLFEKRLDLIRGKRVGLITNPTGVDGHLQSVSSFSRRTRK